MCYACKVLWLHIKYLPSYECSQFCYQPLQLLIFRWIELKFVLNIQETLGNLGNMYSFKELL